MHVDIQVVCPSPTQLPHSIHNNCSWDVPSFPVGFLPCRKWVEQDKQQQIIKYSTLLGWSTR